MLKDPWIIAVQQSLQGYRRMVDAACGQLSDEQFFFRPQPNQHSVASLLRHLGGNLQSRWTEFLTSDGEKPTRDRDAEFEDWQGSRDELLEYFDQGWQRFAATLDELSSDDLQRQVSIRGESHSVPQAVQRSLTHVAYHVGQLVMIARQVFGDDARWKWMTIRPGGSAAHNRDTWGTSASRSVAGEES